MGSKVLPENSALECVIIIIIIIIIINIKRHDTVCAQLHFNICKEIGVKL
jgi:hypothetical protein